MPYWKILEKTLGLSVQVFVHLTNYISIFDWIKYNIWMICLFELNKLL